MPDRFVWINARGIRRQNVERTRFVSKQHRDYSVMFKHRFYYCAKVTKCFNIETILYYRERNER